MVSNDPIINGAASIFGRFGHLLNIDRIRPQPTYRQLLNRFETSSAPNYATSFHKAQKVYCPGYSSTCSRCGVRLALRMEPFKKTWSFIIGELVLTDYGQDQELDTNFHHRFPSLVCPRLRNFL